MKTFPGILIHPSGSIEIVDVSERVESLWAIVGNWVEVITPARDSQVRNWLGYCDEEGRMKSLPENTVASAYANAIGWNGQHCLVGPVLFLGADGSGNMLGVSAEMMAALKGITQ